MFKYYDTKNFIISLISWGVGFGLAIYLLPTSNIHPNKTLRIILKTNPFFKLMNNNQTYFSIFTNNLIVGILLIIGGYLSGGILAVLILIWNGFTLGIALHCAINVLQVTLIVRNIIWYSVIEIVALSIFSSIGLNGFYLLKSILFDKEFKITIISDITKIIFATFLLVIAAYIESNF